VRWFAGRGLIQRLAVQAVFLEELVQSRAAHTDVPSVFNELEHVIAGSVGMSHQELCHRSSIAWQKLSIGSAGQLVLNLADDFSGGELVLS
jgi:hypothetical protein